MKISKLVLCNFRNYDNLEVDFGDKLNIIIGNNAQGKTNILEAIYFLSITKSFLGVNDKNLIKKNSNFLTVKGDLINTTGKSSLFIALRNEEKKIEVNKKVVKRHIDYLGNMRVIIYNTDDIKIIRDSPGIRRKFLNIELSQLYNKYAKCILEFNIILKQRNEYLKSIKNFNVNYDYLDILNNKYADLSILIYKYRNNYIKNLNLLIDSIFYEISGMKGLYLKYETDFSLDDENSLKEIIISKLKDNLNREILYGVSLYGPHKDNFTFFLNELNLSLYGSQGQQKMAILALKMAEIDIFSNTTGDKPILLLDDIFSELDVDKRNKLVKFLKNDIQTIMTTTDINDIDSSLVENANVYLIENGKIINSCFK